MYEDNGLMFIISFFLSYVHTIQQINIETNNEHDVKSFQTDCRDQKEEETEMVWPCKKNGRVQTAKKGSRNETN
jgi:hypothetical protein